MRNLILAAAATVAALGAVPAAADVKAGVDAWSRGDYATAIDQWRPLAIAGDADAQFNLAQAYKLGRGVTLDPALAESWFRKAALQGHVQAQDNYGLALFQANKKADALPWLEKSVARGEPRTQLVLGTMLFNGDAVPRDYPRAYALMSRASTSGLQSASQTLAQMDQYISPEDRQRGTALAERYAAQEKIARSGLSSASSPPISATGPSRPAPRPAPQPAPQPAPRPVTPVARTTVPASSVSPAPVPQRAVPERAPAPAPRAAAKPAPKPVPKPAAKPVAGSGKWRIQLGAFRDRGNAETLWGKVRGRLGGAQPSYVTAGPVTRLQAGGFASRADATRACAASGQPCVIVAP
jgi:cell division septation protein DedD